MWKRLYLLFSPKLLYNKSTKCIFPLSICTALILFSGIVWGLVFAPADYQQGDAFRILYVHVPCAFLSMAVYASMGFLSLSLLIWRVKLAGVLLGILAELGALMTILALVTGSIWGKPMWGAWWVWDARLTSELILLFLYAAIWITGQSYSNKAQSDKIIAIITLVGLVDLPIIHYSVYWWNTLHQGSTLLAFSKPKIASSMLYPLLLTLLGLSLYSLLVVVLKLRSELLVRERRQAWVSSLIHTEGA